MGSAEPLDKHRVFEGRGELRTRAFAAAVLADLRALEAMLDRGRIERGVRRMGVEQELFLVDARLRPAPVGPALLASLADPRFTPEIARFQIEVDLPPTVLEGGCLRALEASLTELIARADTAARPLGARVALTGILPTIAPSDLGIENLSPDARYVELNRVLTERHGGAFPILVEGVDRLETTHDNVLFEGCNASFQLHLQVDPPALAPLHNLAQAISAPLLAAAASSPLLFGRRLWRETRIALFEQGTDARSVAGRHRGQPPRVFFGERWAEASVLEIYREQIARYPVLLSAAVEEDSMALVDAGAAPALRALCLHNGTIWRWNRACYGVSEGKAHLRIEHRPLPAGPTVLDEVANAALFYGLMIALPEEIGDPRRRMRFDDARANFLAAARHGLGARFTWLDRRDVGAAELLLDPLLPLARRGLAAVRVPEEDIDRYLGVVEARVRTGQSGAEWMLRSLDSMATDANGNANASSAASGRSLVRAMLARQSSGDPVHTWPMATREDEDDRASYGSVEQLMSTDLFTVGPDDVADLATSVMEWQHVRHVPVEDAAGRPVGVVSHRALLKLARQKRSQEQSPAADGPRTVADIMEPTPPLVAPGTPLREAMAAMAAADAGCLLVVSRGRLVGVVTERDLVRASAALLK